MSAGNISKYENYTVLNDVENNINGFSFLQTSLLALCVFSCVLLFSYTVYYIIKKKSLDDLRHRLVPLYHFDPGECEDWEDELLEDVKKENRKNNIHFYRSMSTPLLRTQP